MNTKSVLSIAATVAIVAAGVIIAGYILQMGKDLPFLMDSHKGYTGAA